MYSYDDRLRAVKLYIQYSKSATDTIRELGYPSRKNLRRWYRSQIETGGAAGAVFSEAEGRRFESCRARHINRGSRVL